MDREVLFLIIGLIGGGIVSLIINYFTHFTADPLSRKYKEWSSTMAQAKAKQSIAEATKRIAMLEARQQEVTRYIDSPSVFLAYCIQSLVWSTSFVIMASVAFFLIFFFFRLQAPGLPIFRPPIEMLIFGLWILLAIIVIPHQILNMSFDLLDPHDRGLITRVQIAELQEVINQGHTE